MVSSCVTSLEAVDRTGYLRKLLLTNNTQLPDPCGIHESKWSNDESKWPLLQWPDIHCYLIENPSVYTQGKLRAYKLLEAYTIMYYVGICSQ